MRVSRLIPKSQYRCLTARRKTTYFFDFHIYNKYGEKLELDPDSLRGFVWTMNGCMCPPILEFCVEQSQDACDLYTIFMDARTTEKLKCGDYYFTIDQNWREPISNLERPMTKEEIEMFEEPCELTVQNISDFSSLEPKIPAMPTFRIMEGKLTVKL